MLIARHGTLSHAGVNTLYSASRRRPFDSEGVGGRVETGMIRAFHRYHPCELKLNHAIKLVNRTLLLGRRKVLVYDCCSKLLQQTATGTETL